jgi:hypothetical protein
MTAEVTLNSICLHSEDVVVREIEGEILIVPLVSSVGVADDELYTLNETGQAIWQKLDGKRSLKDIAVMLAQEFDCGADGCEADVLGFSHELTRRGILVANR